MPEETAQSASGEAVHATHPMIGIVAVLLGAMIATAQGRLTSVEPPVLAQTKLRGWVLSITRQRCSSVPSPFISAASWDRAAF
jgi:hypothetical protein